MSLTTRIVITHFSEDEFRCKCGCGKAEMDSRFLVMIDEARRLAGIPFAITSGYRCEAHNAAVGSTSTNHTKGLAADIACNGGPDRYDMVASLIKAGFRRIGLAKKFIHCDINDGPGSIWLY